MMPVPLVLIVEDDTGLRRVLALLFENEGWMVVEATDGRTGLRLAQRVNPDAIVTDLRMPKMSGVELARALTSPGDQRPPIVAITSAGRGTKRAAEESGLFVDVLGKPLIPEELLKTVARAAIGSTGEESGA